MKIKILLFLVILLAISLRFFNIGSYPATLYGDEQAFTYNAYSILETGKDEYGTSFPLLFRSFDDYKSPIPVYLLVPFIKIFQMTIFGIRLPIVIASVFTVWITYLLFRNFFTNKLSIIGALLMAVSPWHIHLSRGYFEATLSLLFFVSGIYFYTKREAVIKDYILGALSYAISIYCYFTPRILIPLFIILVFFYLRKYRFNKENQSVRSKNYIISLVLLVVVSLPLLQVTFLGPGLSRFSKLSQSMDSTIVETVNRERNTSNMRGDWKNLFHNKVTVKLRLIRQNYLEHLSANFWYIYGDNSLRYFIGNMGMFYLLEFPFFIIGVYSLWKEKRSVALFFLGWILLAPIPASLVGRPFAVRSLALLPAPFVFVSYGIYKIFNGNYASKWKMIGSVAYCLLMMISIWAVLARYYLEYPIYAATWWGWENKKAIDYSRERESEYDNIFLSDFYTGMPLAFAVYHQIDPVTYQEAINHPVLMADGRKLIKFGKYYIGSLDINTERLNTGIIPKSSLYLGRPEEADSEEKILAPDDGRNIFKVYRR